MLNNANYSFSINVHSKRKRKSLKFQWIALRSVDIVRSRVFIGIFKINVVDVHFVERMEHFPMILISIVMTTMNNLVFVLTVMSTLKTFFTSFRDRHRLHFSCQLLHRNANDTEKRYHLRYFKTGLCTHDSDGKGHCLKNGPHCSYAHGANDLRQPVLDSREIQNSDLALERLARLCISLENERALNDDPKWSGKNE